MTTGRSAPLDAGAEVVVVGAGLAGLTAAADLSGRGHQVVVLEARDRIGGRIDSRPMPHGGVAELGAQVLHGSDNPLLDLVEEPSRSLVAGSAPAHADLITPDGQVRDLAGSNGFLPPPALTGALQALRRALGPQMSPRVTLEMALSMMRLPGESSQALPGWLEQVTGADPGAVSLERLCTEPVFSFRTDAEFTVPAGLLTLLAPLAHQVPVHTGHQLLHVGRDTDGVRLTVRTAPETEQTVTAGAVILTVPPPVVGSGQLVVEEMPATQVAAARELSLAPAVVAAVPLREPAPSDGFRCDLAHGCGFMTWVAGRSHVTIVAKGRAAPRLRQLVGEDPAQLTALVEEAGAVGVTTDGDISWHDWTADPFATGAFTLPHEESAAWAQRWSTPVADRIYFAGEATLAGPSSPFLQRARSSGLHASAHIHQITQGVGA